MILKSWMTCGSRLKHSENIQEAIPPRHHNIFDIRRRLKASHLLEYLFIDLIVHIGRGLHNLWLRCMYECEVSRKSNSNEKTRSSSSLQKE